MQYIPAVFVGLDEFGKRIIERFKELLEDKYKRLSIFCSSEPVNIAEIGEEIKKLRGREKEVKFAEVPFFNLITIAKGEFNLNNTPEDLNIRKIHIITEFREASQIDGTVYLFSEENEKREKLSDSEIEDKILYFLLILACSDIYAEQDYDKKFFPSRSVLTLGIDVICPIHMREYLKRKFVNDFLIKFAETAQNELADDEKSRLKEENKKWLFNNSNLKGPLDLNEIFNVKTQKLAPSLVFFASAEFRKRQILEYLKKAINYIREYLTKKKEKAHSLKKVIEQRLMDRLKNLEKTRIEFLTHLAEVSPENNFRNILETIIESDEILTTSELLAEKKKDLKWATLSGYDNFHFPENAPHPNWLVMLILLIISLVPTIVEIFIPKIPLFSYLKWTLVFSLPLIIYTIFSVISLSLKVRQIIADWLNKIKIVDDFFAQNFNKNFDSVHNFYEIWYLNVFRIFFRNRIPQIMEFLSELHGVNEKNKIVFNGLKEKIESKIIDKLNEIKAKYDLKSIFTAYLNGEKPEDYLNRIATDFSDENIKEPRRIISDELMKEKINTMVRELKGEISLPMLYNPSQFSIVSGTTKQSFFYSQQIEEITTKKYEIYKIDYPIFYGVIQFAQIKKQNE